MAGCTFGIVGLGVADGESGDLELVGAAASSAAASASAVIGGFVAGDVGRVVRVGRRPRPPRRPRRPARRGPWRPAGLSQGTAGSIYQVIDFTNISNGPCTLYGYPGVSLASGAPVTQVGAAASRSSATAAALVTLARARPPTRCCGSSRRATTASTAPTTTTYLQIYPPNETTPIYLGYKSTGCASSAVKLLSVGVVTAGTGG